MKYNITDNKALGPSCIDTAICSSPIRLLLMYENACRYCYADENCSDECTFIALLQLTVICIRGTQRQTSRHFYQEKLVFWYNAMEIR